MDVEVGDVDPIDEFTFCDDCGGTDHTWENCPMTKNYVYEVDDESPTTALPGS